LLTSKNTKHNDKLALKVAFKKVIVKLILAATIFTWTARFVEPAQGKQMTEMSQ